MAIQFSDALANFLLKGGAVKDALDNGKIEIYTGAQPANANAAKTGTLIATITNASGAWTAEVQATGTLVIAGASGSIDTFTVDSKEIMGSATPFNTSLTQTAKDIVEKCNNNPKNKLYVLSSVSATITLTAKPGLGGFTGVVAYTATTMTATPTNVGSVITGVDAVNGLVLGDVLAQVLAKHPTQVWSGLGVNGGGVAGWFRFYASVTDAGALDSSAVYKRLDGNIATSGATMNMSNTSIVDGAVQTINSVALTQPEA